MLRVRIALGHLTYLYRDIRDAPLGYEARVGVGYRVDAGQKAAAGWE